MKLNVEIEIPEDELADVLRRVVLCRVEERAKAWTTEKSVADAVRDGWDRGLQQMVDAEIANSDVLRKKVGLELERQIKNKLAAAIRLQEKGAV